MKTRNDKNISDLSIRLKLYLTILVVLASIAGMFVMADVGMNALFSLQAYVAGESAYSKGQKGAVFHLLRYAHTANEDDYDAYLEHMALPLNIKEARLELVKLHPDVEIVYKGFSHGGVFPEETEEMISLFQMFRDFSYVRKALSLWEEADGLNAEIVEIAADIRKAVSSGDDASTERVEELTGEVSVLNHRLHVLEDEFSDTLGEASRWVKNLLARFILGFAVTASAICIVLLLFGGRLARNMNDYGRELRDQNWLKTGQTALNERMLEEKDVSSLSQIVIHSICDYVGADIGAVFVLEDDGRLRLTGGYAHENRKELNNEFSLGEGLVGQAALEKKRICLSPCPRDYFTIRSGLGSAPPTLVVAHPLLRGDKVKGVVEIGAFREFSEKELLFLETVSENIAVAVDSAQSRAKMAALLDRSQRQAEELEVQQEELRQTNEELEHQTRALTESEKLLRAQQVELEITNRELKERSEDLRRQKDEVVEKSREIESARHLIEIKASELEVTSKYKSEFMANMSHELRTPLNSLMILSSLLIQNKEKNLTDKQLEFCRTINSAGAELLNLINSILDLSKIEAGKVSLTPENIKISRLMAEIRAKLLPMAMQKGLEFKIVNEEGAPSRIRSDYQLVVQILNNLLSNAIKFTEKGVVTLTVRNPRLKDLHCLGFPVDNGRYIAFSVKDTGIGIAENKQRMIFEAFQQADGTTQRKFGGTGLGLSISKELARLLGGGIRLVSRPGEGSEFTAVLPAAASARGRKRLAGDTAANGTELASVASVESRICEKESFEEFEPTAPPAVAVACAEEEDEVSETFSEKEDAAATRLPCVENIRDDRREITKEDRSVLIIEDDPEFARTLMDLAREQGFKTLVAWEGAAALHLADFYLPGGILLDIGLPGDMDGLNVLAKLKENLNTRHIPVHIVSCYENEQEALRMGAVGFLKKPVSLEQLNGAFDRIRKIISRKVKRLLIVEDDEVESTIVKELLGDKDVEAVVAPNADDALKLLSEGGFDCVVLDLCLPGMSGMEMLEQMRLNEREFYVPVIVFTGKELTPDERVLLDRYAERVVVKGVRSRERLLDETALFLHRVQEEMPEEKRRVIRILHERESIFDGKKVLLADDDMRNVFAITSVLEEKGLELLVAADGRECLEVLEEHPDINLVLIDIMMPVMDGFEAIRRIRKQERFQNLPIITLTAKAMKGDRARCIEAGASDYLAKPVDMDKLLSMLRVWLYQT